jgi:hypothetical protein
MPMTHMTSTTWKQAIFVGGAILVLAACSDATAPEPPANLERTTEQAASRRDRGGHLRLNPQTTDCRSGYSVQVGWIDVPEVCVTY